MGWRERRAAFNAEGSEEEKNVARTHLMWMSRAVLHLQDELHLLSSVHWSKGYIEHLAAHRVDV